ncbi:MAG: response regulator [Clostridiaceae bacterium]
MPEDLLKVVIVDDEHLVRNLLKNCIDWKEIGYEIAGEASHAQEALELVEKVSPDVIFTDICMPYIDGIEFARIVTEKYPLLKIVILTGYEEFEYAKRSIKIGISDFLLKPVNDDEIRKVALNIRKKIESEKNHQAENDRLREHLEENMPYLMEKLLNELVQYNLENEDLRRRLDYFRMKINPGWIQVAIIEVFYPETGTEIGEEEKLLLRMQSVQMIRRYFKEDTQIHIFCDNSQRIVILNSDSEIELIDCLEELKALFINSLKCYVCMGVGNLYHALDKARLSYKEACNALDYKVITGKNQIIHYCDINFQMADQYQIQNEQIESLEFFLKAGMEAKAIELLDSIFNENNLGQRADIDTLRAIASNIVSVVLNVTTKIGIRISDVFINNTQPFDKVFKLDTLPDVKGYLKNLITSAINTIGRIQNKKVNQAVRQVVDYLQENLSNSELSLTNTARVFYMNASYLSRIFKQETGQTFIEYLTKERMEKAISLMKETDLKAYQIAEKVGIVDPHYFGICFKKFTGMSVNDFKREDTDRMLRRKESCGCAD